MVKVRGFYKVEKNYNKNLISKNMPKENEYTGNINPLCQETELWTTRDEQSSEDETNEFLGALIRLIKPKFIVETGCYLGDGTLAMARALRVNGVGRILTCDIIQERVDEVNKRLQEEGLYPEIASAIKCEGEALIKQCGSVIDFAFIDSSPDGKVRGAEIKELLKYLRPLKMFALHDTAPQHKTINAVANMVGLPKVYFNTPRGMTLFMKS
jgi:predicted O-methyltransferase YrrM